MKTEIEEFNSVGKQIIPSKTKYSSLRQYNLKKPKKGDSIILFVLASLVLCMTFSLKMGKTLQS